ncbi:DNA ligase 1 [Rhopalosiphum maidis]|uniref:DNA ligase 1 n=1 Tax=Rhopalosiphum maidis TaxID=43146 RepID=UPI000EFF58ED|nr:DNA ligase 1 [Rhopalosiphum maidis]
MQTVFWRFSSTLLNNLYCHHSLLLKNKKMTQRTLMSYFGPKNGAKKEKDPPVLSFDTTLTSPEDLEVVHTSPIKTYGKRKKHTVLFSDSDEEISDSKKKCVQDILSNKPNVEKLEEPIEEQSPLKDTDKSLIHNKISESEPTKTNDHSLKDTVQDEIQIKTKCEKDLLPSTQFDLTKTDNSHTEKNIINKSSTDKKTKNQKKSSKKVSSEKSNEEQSPTKDDDESSKPKITESEYDPTKKNYHPVRDAFWDHNQPTPYSALTKTLLCIEEVSARLKIIEILSNYFRSVIVVSPKDLLPSVYLCLNKVCPDYIGLELGIAETTLLKAIVQTTGRSMAQVKSDVKKTGDLGIVAEKSKSNQKTMFKPTRLTVKSVFDKLKDISEMTGQAVTVKKLDKIQSMFIACQDSEARFLMRSLAGKLRIGLAEQSVLQALGLACTMTPPPQDFPPETLNTAKNISEEKFKKMYDANTLIIKTTYCESPNLDLIIPIILKVGVSALPENCKLTPGIPLKPMLAHPTKGVHEVLSRFDGLKFTCEWKYDGERAQIHLTEDGNICIYSRNQENNTSKYPDIINRLDSVKGPNVKSFVMDSEAVAWDRENKKIMPFQILSTRKRKNANEADIKVQVCVYMFDLLYLNGESLVKRPFCERRQLLRENFIEVEEQFLLATSLDTTKMEEVQDFLEESIKGNCEGLMVKTLEEEATYEIAKRSRNWLKLKKDYLDGVGDTIDVVVLGGYLGRGKRTGTYGGFLLACYDPDSEEYQSICKIGTGFSDEDLQTHTEFFQQHIIEGPKSYYRFDQSHEPDHWFETVQVWEIKCADLSLSPVHRAALGIVDPEKGISLRFPRFLRIREDKSIEQSTSAQQIAELYFSQVQIINQGSTNTNREDFY